MGAEGPAAAAASTSSVVMREPDLGFTVARSTPRCCASLRAAGDVATRSRDEDPGTRSAGRGGSDERAVRAGSAGSGVRTERSSGRDEARPSGGAAPAGSPNSSSDVDALIADAQGIADYYTGEVGADTELLTYGAPVQTDPSSSRLPELDLTPHAYHLVVARFEPENHVAEIVAGYHASTSRLPLVVVGSAPYSDDYTARINDIANGDARIRILGGIWDQEQLDQLYANALTYLHGHSVGGTNPSLLRALGAGTAVIAYDVDFNREVLGGEGRFFDTSADVSMLIEAAEADPADAIDEGQRLQKHADANYRWDDVTDGYAALLTRLKHGFSQRGRFDGRRASANAAIEPARSMSAEVKPS